MLLPLKGYPEGYDLTLVNTIYHYPFAVQATTGNKDDKYDLMEMVIRDNVLGKKFVYSIKNPTYQYYMANDDVAVNNHELFLDRNKVHMVEVPYKNLLKDIAKRTDKESFFYDNIRSNNRDLNQQLHADNRVFFSDSNIEDHYRFRFSNSYKNTSYAPTKGYFDIEVDSINMKGDFPELGECPINAISYINEENLTIYVFLLRNKKNPLITQFEKDIRNGRIIPELKAFIRENVGGWKNEIRFGLSKDISRARQGLINTDLRIQFMMYDEEDEIKLIADFFNAVNQLQPDFMLAWNMAFDIPYILNRILRLGYKPTDIMCHNDFKLKFVEYNVDTKNLNAYANRGDYCKIASYSVWLDQMIHFASRRKGQAEYVSYSLDSIGEDIAKVKKLDYHHITTNLTMLPYLDYKTFVFYNVMDTIVQKCIEAKTGDMDFVFNKALINNTRYNKIHRQTVYLANRGANIFYENGYIIGNNINKWNPKPAEKFPGAFVADPLKLTDYCKYQLYDNSIMVYDNSMDFDFKSLYPSIERQFNMAPNTTIGKIDILSQVHPDENKFGIDRYSRNSAFMEDFQSHNTLEFCSRWLRMANYQTLVHDVQDYYTNVRIPTNRISRYGENNNGMTKLFIKYGKDAKFVEREPSKDMIPLFIHQVPKMNMTWKDVYR